MIVMPVAIPTRHCGGALAPRLAAPTAAHIASSLILDPVINDNTTQVIRPEIEGGGEAVGFRP
jgi:hypothetical protein